MSKRQIIDLTLGDPALGFKEIMNYACEHSHERMNEYIVNTPDYFGPKGAKDIKNALKEIAPAMVNYGFADKKDEKNLVRKSIMTGGGSSEAFGYILKILQRDVQKQRKAGKQITPAIVMPVPTYGYFATMARDAGHNIAIIPRDMDKKGALDTNRITNSFREIHERGVRIIAYYDSNPHNPSGLVRGEEETRAIARSIQEMNDYYASLNDRWNGPASRIRIIDDFANFGSEYNKPESAFSFAQIPECRDDTFLLLCLSKIGLAGLRAGYTLASEDNIKLMRDAQQLLSYYPSRPTIHGLIGYYRRDKEFQKRRMAHLENLNKTHKESGDIVKALINGLDSMDELNKKEKEAVIKRLATLKNISTKEAASYLNNPVPYINIVTTPESGMFHILSMEALRGKKYRRQDTKKFKTFKNSEDINTSLRLDYDILLVPSDWMGSKIEELIYRFNYSCPIEEIMEAIERLHDFIAYIETHED